MSLLRVLNREIVSFHERLTKDKPYRHDSDKTTDLAALPVAADCLIVVCVESEKLVRTAFPQYKTVLCEGSMSLLDYLEQLDRRPVEILIASPTVQCALLLNSDHLRQLATFCLRKLWLRTPHSWLAERLLRIALHRVGFYEVADCIYDQATSRYERSSVGLYPTGEFQMIDRLPGMTQGKSAEWLLASRIPLLETAQLPWKWVYGEGTLDADGCLSAASDTAPILSVTSLGHTHDPSSTIRIQARIRWQCPVEGSAVGSLVGCYGGPGDSNMYLAMVEPHTENLITASLWRNVGSWEQICRTSVSLPDAECPQPTDQTSVEVALEISQDQLKLHCNGEVVLSATDDALPRNYCYGARMLGAQLQVEQIEAFPLY